VIAYKTSPAFKPKPEASRKKGGVDLGAMGIFFLFPRCHIFHSAFPPRHFPQKAHGKVSGGISQTARGRGRNDEHEKVQRS